MYLSVQALALAAAILLYVTATKPAVPTPSLPKISLPKLSLTPLETQLICLKGEIALGILNKIGLQGEAYSFCSSFISIPAATASVTLTEKSFTASTTTRCTSPKFSRKSSASLPYSGV
ncbi:hypothetical protein BCR34DRAFT_582232 [Clohesyomyces aquaticus]|uniref:Secreted protein n=1 Tax=Clohesyomyces aquaticus TaxID=1231657 RepID=A0A1Y2AAG0_9PLEO|nr:hypothetical protein BCR34DRAFT_582232 [Clohesyomyces aquaticus]